MLFGLFDDSNEDDSERQMRLMEEEKEKLGIIIKVGMS